MKRKCSFVLACIILICALIPTNVSASDLGLVRVDRNQVHFDDLDDWLREQILEIFAQYGATMTSLYVERVTFTMSAETAELINSCLYDYCCNDMLRSIQIDPYQIDPFWLWTSCSNVFGHNWQSTQ